ncbi:MAG: SGNH/GDSL hydrolase family protein [Oscillospiraceae bacterium]
MKKLKLTSFLAASALCISLFSGCADSTAAADDTEKVSETTAAVTLSYPAIKEDASLSETEKRMLETSLVSVGNTSRLNEKLQTLENGGEITLGFIGGSITYGYTVQPNECFASKLTELLKERYPNGTVNYVNKGISGTPSILGNLRLKRDILDNNADIIFVEYAVNDGMESDYKESYDSLVRTALEQENEPAVVLILNRTKEGHSAQEYMKSIGNFYSLPMISTADALTEALDSGTINWEDLYNDSSHPNPNGHELFCKLIANALDESLKTQSEEYVLPSESIFGAPYENAVIIEADYDGSDSRFTMDSLGSFTSSSSADGFTKGWAFDKETNEPMKFTVDANGLFIICRRNNNDSMGKFEVYINGERAKTVDTNQKDGWGDPYAFKIIKWQETKNMEIEIRPAEDSLQKNIEILGIGFSSK